MSLPKSKTVYIKPLPPEGNFLGLKVSVDFYRNKRVQGKVDYISSLYPEKKKGIHTCTPVVFKIVFLGTGSQDKVN
jgi:hypothetical protein